jgi:hypothetical protein
MAARIAEVRDAAAAKITAAWSPADPDGVVARYRVDIDSATHEGRKVYVFPSATASPEPATRGEDVFDYTLAFMVIERFTAADGMGDPAEAWVDERVAWVEWLWKLLGDARAERLLADEEDPDSGLWPEVAEITTVYDLEELAERKLFVSVVTVTYREHSAD